MSLGSTQAIAHDAGSFQPGAPPPDLLNDLLTSYRRNRPALAPDAAALVERALDYARQAEDRLSAQQNRIAELENLSVTDPLTGLLNRRGFDDALVRVLAETQRHRTQGLLAYIDLDGFKAVNDSFGHGAGDAVLKHVADLLRRAVRSTDYLARLGGDEFAIILTNTAPHALKPVAQKLRRTLNSSAARAAGRLIHIRASLGIEAFGATTDFDQLITEADRAMYRAKQRRAQTAA